MDEKCSCALCGNLSIEGLRIHGEFICSSCEYRITQMHVQDEDYEDWINNIRPLWSKWIKQV